MITPGLLFPWPRPQHINVILITKQLPRGRAERAIWQHFVELLMQAHKTGKAEDIRAATDQLCRALQLEGWI